MDRNKTKSSKSKSKQENMSSRRLDTALEIHQALFEFSSHAFWWESMFEQDHNREQLAEMLTTNPHMFKHCKLRMDSHDLAYTKPLNDLTSVICIRGRDNIGRSFPGDEVCVQVFGEEAQPHHGDLLNGKVVGLLERSEECCTVICKMGGNNRLVTPVKNNMSRICILQKEPNKIEIRKRNPQAEYWSTDKCIDIVADQLLIVQVLKWDRNRRYPLGAVTKVISTEEYYNEVLKVKSGITGTPPPFEKRCDQEKDGKRENFCNHTTFTIDNNKARDLDDAISVKDEGDQYMIGIHITDVASHIRKGSKEDVFAKKQGRTIYPPAEVNSNSGTTSEPAFMLSGELSFEHLSLRENQIRNAISLVIMINKVTGIIESGSFTLSRIKSDKQLSYEKADKIIKEHCLHGMERPLEVSNINDCVAVVYWFSKVLRKYRLEGSWSIGQKEGEDRAHCMVEELMNFYNNAVAEELISKNLTRDLTPLRCHSKPDPGMLDQFIKEYSVFLPLSPYLSQAYDVMGAGFEETTAKVPFIHVLTPVFQQMKALAQDGDYHKLLHLIISDEIHPTLLHMANAFKEIQRKSVILRSCSNLSSKLGHHALQLNAYTTASSPMRRYLDLVLQRLLHSVLSEMPTIDMDYTKEEINQFCDESENAEDLDLESVRFINATKSGCRNMTKLAVVDGHLSPKEHEFSIVFPLESMPQLLIKYRNLKVVEQPNYDDQGKSCTLKWKRRVYSFSKMIKAQSNFNKNVTPISVQIWTKMILALKREDWDTVRECLQDVKERDLKCECDSISNASPNSQNHFKDWNIDLKVGEVLQVQLDTEIISGATITVVNLLTVSASFEVCLEHARNPIKCFTTTDDTVCHAKTEYRTYTEYQEIWGKLCRMDTAYNAVEENNSVILEEVSIKWTESTETSLKGFFRIPQARVKEWSLEFDLTNCYLCIRLRDHYAGQEDNTNATAHNSPGLYKLQNTLPFTWVAHGVPTKCQGHKQQKKKKTNKQSNNQINFQINQHNMTNIPPEVLQKETKFTVEVIPKKIPYVQYEHAVDNITKANDLVKSIATGPRAFNASRERGVGLELHSVDDYMYDDMKQKPIEEFNDSQARAVWKALNNPFTVIQGPPGTGKTVVGVWITYSFYLKNQALREESPNQPPSQGQHGSPNEYIPKKRGILYCGPSNKSVDIVAEQLLELKGDLKLLRIYCDQMEMREYPFPGSDLQLCRKSLRDEKPKEVLRGISLMHLVRQDHNPCAKQIKDFENGCVEFNIESYRKVLREAQRHELRKHDVILCTCSTALKPVLKETMDFQQILIDECAMATEPETFIPLVSHNPKQIVLLGDHKQIRPIVTCVRVKELGMEKSLFERYMDKALMLDTQYRMHKNICEFPSKEFYGGKLKTGRKASPCLLLDMNNSPTAILFGHVEGEEISLVVSTTAGNEHSAANKLEAEQAVRVARLLIHRSGVKPEHIAILTPYNAQMSKIKEMLAQKENQDLHDVSVCTIMKSQGTEWHYVIVSTVRSCPLAEIEKEMYFSKGWLGKRLGFIMDPNQVNVAITRAKDLWFIYQSVCGFR